MQANKNQNLLIDKFAKYLDTVSSDLKPEKKEYQELKDLQKKIETNGGLCHGLSVIHAIMHLPKNVQRGMPAWWDDALTQIATWDEKPESLQKLTLLKNAQSAKPLGQIFDQVINDVLSNQLTFNDLGPRHPVLDKSSQAHPEQHFSVLLPKAPSSQPLTTPDSQSSILPTEEKKALDAKPEAEDIMQIGKQHAIAGNFSAYQLARILDYRAQHALANNPCLIENNGHTCSLRFDMEKNGWFFHDPNYDATKESGIASQEKFFSDEEDLAEEILKRLGNNIDLRVWELTPINHHLLDSKLEGRIFEYYYETLKKKPESFMHSGGLDIMLEHIKLFTAEYAEIIRGAILDPEKITTEVINGQNRPNGPILQASYSNNEKILAALISRGADKAAKDEYGNSTSSGAVLNSNEKYLGIFQEDKPEINHQDVDGDTLLIKAVIHGNDNIVATVIKRGSDVTITNNRGRNALMYAVDAGDIAKVLLLLTKTNDINHRNKEGQTALLQAVMNGDKAIVALLIGNGADLHLKYTNELTIIEIAADKGNFEICEILLEAIIAQEKSTHLEQKTKSADGQNDRVSDIKAMFFRHASAKGDMAIVKKYLSIAADEDLSTAFRSAAKNFRFDICKLLFEKISQKETVLTDSLPLEIKGSPTTKDQQKKQTLLNAISKQLPDELSLFMYAVGMGTTAAVKWIYENTDSIDLLAVDIEGRTPLMIAVAKGDAEMARFLLSCDTTTGKPSLNATMKNGDTALIMAIQLGRLDLVHLLVKSGANLAAEAGASVLMEAVKRCHYPMVNYLLSKGVVIEKSAITAALTAGYFNMAQLLLNKEPGTSHDIPDSKNVNKVDKPLLLWALNNLTTNKQQVIELMLNTSTVNIDASDENGKTALMSAVNQEDITIVKLLCDAGASINLKDKKGGSALQLSEKYTDLRLHNILKKSDDEFNDFLNVKFGIDGDECLIDSDRSIIARHLAYNPDRCTDNGKTALHYAIHAEELMPPALKLLLEIGARNLPDKLNVTPLIMAAQLLDETAANTAMEKILKNSRPLVNIDHLDTKGNSAFYYIAARGNLDLVTLLREKGADCRQALMGAVENNQL